MSFRFSAFYGVLLSLLMPSVSYANVLKGDAYFEKEQYQKARLEYLESAEIGSPHAYYQLGLMSFKGIGQKQDFQQAILWFSLAAEYDFEDSKDVVARIYQKLPRQLVAEQEKRVKGVLQQYGKAEINLLYFPEIRTERLGESVSFGESGSLASLHDDEAIDGLSLDSFDEIELPATDFGSQFEEGEEFAGFDEPFSAAQEPAALTNPLRNRPYMAIVDYEVAPDGSIRNIIPVQTMGSFKKALDGLAHETQAQPGFEGGPAWFTHRSYLGMASLDRRTFQEQHPYLYGRIKRVSKRKKESPVIKDQFQYAMSLLHFPWLKQEEGEALRVLRKCAKAGHPVAQYEYALQLYREQKNIPAAIRWLSKASKYGLSKAEYFMGNLLLHSPWVKKDELKALYWFESAAEQDFKPAIMKAAELRLTIKDEAFRDLQMAIHYLDKIEGASRNNPQYYYLRALSFRHKNNRDLRQAFGYMRRAIETGDRYNWDTSDWYNQLHQWMSGRILVTDIEQPVLAQ